MALDRLSYFECATCSRDRISCVKCSAGLCVILSGRLARDSIILGKDHYDAANPVTCTIGSSTHLSAVVEQAVACSEFRAAAQGTFRLPIVLSNK